MEYIGIIASVIAAVATIITLIFTIRNSKGNVNKRIERKQRKIHDIENQFARTYGLNVSVRNHYPTLMKVEKLEREISELNKKI